MSCGKDARQREVVLRRDDQDGIGDGDLRSEARHGGRIAFFEADVVIEERQRSDVGLFEGQIGRRQGGGRGGQLSYVFPTIYGGAIALAATVGWLVLKDDMTPLRLAGVGVIVAGIGMLAVS